MLIRFTHRETHICTCTTHTHTYMHYTTYTYMHYTTHIGTTHTCTTRTNTHTHKLDAKAQMSFSSYPNM